MFKEIPPQIEELPDLKAAWYESYKYFNEPLLEYVWQVANKFLPSFDGEHLGESSAIGVFCHRYFTSKLDENSTFNSLRVQKYTENEELQKTLKAFQLDTSKLWYLILFVHDYVESLYNNANPIEQSLLKEANTFNDKLSTATSISLANGRKSYSTDREDMIRLIRISFDYFIQSYNKIINDGNLSWSEKREHLENIGMDKQMQAIFDADIVNHQKEVTLKPIHKIIKVVEMFKYFLKDKTADKTAFAGQVMGVSTDKMILISRIIYIMDYGGKRYNEEYDDKGNKNRVLSNSLRSYDGKAPIEMRSKYYF